MSQKTNIVINLEATDLSQSVGLSQAEFSKLQDTINEVLSKEADRANEDPEGKGINLLNIMSDFNEKLTIPEFLLVSAFFASEVFRRNNSNPLESLLRELQEEIGDKEELLVQGDLENPTAQA